MYKLSIILLYIDNIILHNINIYFQYQKKLSKNKNW